MKKLLIVILSVIASACLIFGVAGCDKDNSGDSGEKGHVHTYSTEYTFDETYHWRTATCEHTGEIADKAAHTVVDGECTVCKYAVMKIDVEKVIKAFIDNGYTLTINAEGETIEVSESFNDRFAKVRMGDNKALIDASGVYFFTSEEGSTRYIAIDKLFEMLFEQATGMKFSTFIETANYFLSTFVSEDWTVDDVVAIVWDGETFNFDEAKAKAFVEDALFNEGVTVAQVEEMAQDGITYEEVQTIFKPMIIALVENAIPENLTLEGVMPYFANITPAKVKALFDAFCAGELNADYINALLPDGITLDTVKLLFPEINIDDIIEKVNSVVKFINSIDFDRLAFEIEQAQIRAFNKVLSTLFVEEKLDAGVKYTLNYGIIKDANEYLYTTTLEGIINTVIKEGFVDEAANYLVFLLDSKLSDLKPMLESAIGIELEALLDEIDKYAEEFAPTINQIINSIIEEQSYATNVDVLPVIQGATAMAREYLADEEFMGRTLGETIEIFAGEDGMTVEKMKEYLAIGVEFLKANTVYDVLFNVGVIKDKAGLYNRINEFADMLTENFPVYFVINAAGELEELSISATIISEDGEDRKEFSVSLKKGDLIGDVFTEEEKTEIASAATKYTLADFEGYEYNYLDWGNIEKSVKVEITSLEDGSFVITRTDGDYVDSNTDTYFIEDADFTANFIGVGANGEIYYEVETDDDWSLTIIFDKDGKSYLEDDEWHFAPVEEELEVA